jgi:predicted RNA binding protein YcfA (HicA-like mRNA interferase family)
MTKREKRLQRLRRNPKNLSFDDLKQVLEDYGFQHIRTAGSHHTFVAIIGERNWRLTIPLQHPIKSPYIRQTLQAIDEIILLQKENAQIPEETEEDKTDGDNDD